MKKRHADIEKPPLRVLALTVAAGALLAACGGGSSDAPTVPRAWATGQAYRDGVVAAQNPHAAQAGLRILKEGGNAIDAAVAAAYALNVVEPVMSGIGGGGFMMIHLANGETFAIDSREMAPGGATRDMFVGMDDPSLQGVAVGVPGMVRGTALAVEQYGRLTLAKNLQPAIDLAADGFAATPLWTRNACNSRARNSPQAEAYFCPGGQAVPVGERVTNAPLAETFRLIAKNGPDCFYRMMPEKGCDIAQGIVHGQTFAKGERGKGGTMTLADLESYQPAVRRPVQTQYRGWTLKSMAPPSSGGLTVFQILGMLERFPLGDKDAGYGFGAPKTLNAMADATRLAYADRRDWMGDSDLVPMPVRGLTSPATWSSAASPSCPAPGWVRIRPAAIPGLTKPKACSPARNSV
jgi:gamma-glutamyltranspeptidase/glutathione hydrolase